MSTWETRELPLLRAIDTELTKKRPWRRVKGASVADLATATGFSKDEVCQSLRVLTEAHAPYVTGRNLLHEKSRQVVTGLTERARMELDRTDRDLPSPGPGSGVAP